MKDTRKDERPDAAGPLTVVIADADGDSAALAKKAFAAQAGARVLAMVRDRASVVATVADLNPEVVLLDTSATQGQPAAVVREIIARAPNSTVVLSGPSATAPELILQTFVAGASGWQPKPCAPDELLKSVLDAHAQARELQQLRRGDSAIDEKAARGAVIAVYSPKGGVGCTTIAANLAVAMAAKTRASSVALVDLDLQFGDIATALDLKSSNTILDLLSFNGALDASIVRDVFVQHESGLRALIAPDSLSVVEAIDPTKVVRTIDGLRDHFAYIVCDLWSSLEDLTMAVLGVADRVILVTTPELPSLRNLRRVLRATESIQLEDRASVVVNRWPGKAGLDKRDIERALGQSIKITIPSDGVHVTEAINRGYSLFDQRAHARVSGSFRDLAAQLLRELGPRHVPDIDPVPERHDARTGGAQPGAVRISELRARP